jgi:hypothetical protein
MPVNSGGRPIVPPFKPLQKFAEKHARVSNAVRESAVSLDRHDGELEAAERADRERYAERLTADVAAADPGDSSADRVRAKIDSAQRRHGALLVAIEQCEQQIADALAANGEKWARAERGNLEAIRREYADAIERVAAGRAEVDEQRALVAWLERADLSRGWKVPQLPLRSRALIGQNGQPPQFATVMNGLRDDADDAKPEAGLPRMPVPPKDAVVGAAGAA